MQYSGIKKIGDAIHLNALFSGVRKQLPVARRPEEKMINYVAREGFLVLSKLVFGGAIVFGATLLATGGTPALILATAIFSAILSNQIASFIENKKISKAVGIALGILAVPMGVVGLYGLGGHIAARLVMSACLAVVFEQFAFRKRENDLIEIKGTKDQLLQELKKLKDENREIKNLSIECEEWDMGKKAWTALSHLKPQKITIKNYAPLNYEVEEFNNQLNPAPNKWMQFYYRCNEEGEDYQLALAVCPSSETFVVDEYVPKAGRGDYICKYAALEKRKEVKNVRCDAEISTDETKLILDRFHPEAVGFFNPSPEVLNLLNMPLKNKEESYYYKIQTGISLALKEAIDREYQVGIGQDLTEEHVLKCLDAMKYGLDKVTICQPSAS